MEFAIDTERRFYKMLSRPAPIVASCFRGHRSVTRQTDPDQFAQFFEIRPRIKAVYRIKSVPHEKTLLSLPGTQDMDRLLTERCFYVDH